MRRPSHDGHKPLVLQEKATTSLLRHFWQYTRTRPRLPTTAPEVALEGAVDECRQCLTIARLAAQGADARPAIADELIQSRKFRLAAAIDDSGWCGGPQGAKRSEQAVPQLTQSRRASCLSPASQRRGGGEFSEAFKTHRLQVFRGAPRGEV